MKPKITQHAALRLEERTSIRPEALVAMIKAGATSVIEMLAAAKYAHHLFYSPEDMDWYVAIVKNSRQILTVMPAGYEQKRVRITAAQKRSVRRKALDWERQGGLSAAPLEQPAAQASNVSSGTTNGLPGWKVIVSYTLDGCPLSKNLGRTNEAHGTPEDWSEHGEVHHWLKKRLMDTGIPVRAIRTFRVEKKSGEPLDGWHLLENLPLTPEEIDDCA
jgi:hypothetical protein